MRFSGRLPQRWPSVWRRAGRRAQALSLIATGTALAMVFGIPIGRIIGQYFGWRMTFLAIGLGALATLACLVKLLPTLPSEHSGSLKKPAGAVPPPGAGQRLYSDRGGGDRPLYRLQLYRTLCPDGGGHWSGNFATVLLLILGGAGIIGSILFGKLGNQHASGLISIAISACCWPALHCSCLPRTMHII